MEVDGVLPDAESNVYLTDIGTGDGQFSYVANVELDDQGNVYVNDIENHRIQTFKLLPPLGQEP